MRMVKSAVNQSVGTTEGLIKHEASKSGELITYILPFSRYWGKRCQKRGGVESVWGLA